MRERRPSPGRAAVLHTLGPVRRDTLLHRHPDLASRSYPERHAIFLRSYPDPFDVLAPALREQGWVVVDVVVDDPALPEDARLRAWLRRFAPRLVIPSEPATGLWSPGAASFMGRTDVAARQGVLRLGPGSDEGPVSLARYARFGRVRVVWLDRGASEAAGRAAAATGAVVVGPAVQGAPWPTFRDEAEAQHLVQRALNDDVQARAWLRATQIHLLEERRRAVLELIATVPPPKESPPWAA